MKVTRLRTLSRLTFGIEDVARILGTSVASAKVFCSRQVKAGELVRLKRNTYLLRERWEHLTQEERFRVANVLQVPSYVSLMSALSYYGLTTQLQQDFVESVGIYRTKTVVIRGAVFGYTKIARKRYGGFVKRDGFFLALPEKALVDAVYLSSMRRYRLDWSSVDLRRLRRREVQRLAKPFPRMTQRLLSERWKP